MPRAASAATQPRVRRLRERRERRRHRRQAPRGRDDADPRRGRSALGEAPRRPSACCRSWSLSPEMAGRAFEGIG